MYFFVSLVRNVAVYLCTRTSVPWYLGRRDPSVCHSHCDVMSSLWMWRLHAVDAYGFLVHSAVSWPLASTLVNVCFQGRSDNVQTRYTKETQMVKTHTFSIVKIFHYLLLLSFKKENLISHCFSLHLSF